MKFMVSTLMVAKIVITMTGALLGPVVVNTNREHCMASTASLLLLLLLP